MPGPEQESGGRLASPPPECPGLGLLVRPPGAVEGPCGGLSVWEGL